MKTTRPRITGSTSCCSCSRIAYVDRVNMSVAGKPIAHEFGLSPVALGYLFSSFLWAYVLMMLPGGRLIDRWGTQWSLAWPPRCGRLRRWRPECCGGRHDDVVARLGLGIGEAPFSPVVYRSVRAWSPYTERGTATASSAPAAVSVLHWGAGRGLADPDIVMALVIPHHRAIGFAWGWHWMALVSTPEKTPGCLSRSANASSPSARPVSRCPITAASGIRAAAVPGDVGSVHLAGLPRLLAYLYLSWLPNYLQTSRGMSVVDPASTPLFRFSLRRR